MLIIIVAAVVITIFFISRFPVLFKRGYDMRTEGASQNAITLDGSALFVSDFQLRTSDLDVHFSLPLEGIEHLVIVGDLFNSPAEFYKMGSSDEERLANALATCIPAEFSGTIFYIYGNHDPVLQREEFLVGQHRIRFFKEFVQFVIQGTSVIVFHGHQLHDGLIGGGVSWLAQKLHRPLPFERLAKKRYGIDTHTWLVTGHSHVPAIDHENKIANTGSFAGAPFNFFFQIHVGTAVRIDSDGVQLLECKEPSRNFYWI